MRIAITSNGQDLNASFSPVFGRAPYFIIVDTENMNNIRAIVNDAMNVARGAGFRAAQNVIDQNVEAVLTGNIGPNSFDILQRAGIKIYSVNASTVKDAIDMFLNGNYVEITAPTRGFGSGYGRGFGRGFGRGGFRGSGYGKGFGQGRGFGRRGRW